MDDYIFTINRSDFKNLFKLQEKIIEFKKEKDYIDKTEFLNYSNLKKEIKKNDNEDTKWFEKTINNSSFQTSTMSQFLVKYNDMYYKDSWLNVTDNKDEISKSQFFKWIKRDNGDIEVTLKTDGSEKQDAISCWMHWLSWNILEPMNYIEREKY